MAHAVREHASFVAGAWTPNPVVAVLAPDGQHLAVSDAEHTWLVNLADLRVARGRSHVAIALGISPDERRLWLVGERGRVSALPLPWVR